MTPIPPPPTRNRLPVYDTLRGVAILGILLANIAAFGGPVGKELVGLPVSMTPTEQWVDAGIIAFVTGKFRSMLAILFGVGMAMQYQKIVSSGGKWPGIYLRRTGWLAIIGLVHGIFFWFGDILLMYSVTAFISCLFLHVARPTLSLIVKVAGIIALSLGVVIGVAMPLISESMTPLWNVQREIEVFATGTYLEQLQLRSLAFAMMVASMTMMLLWLVPLFLLGALWCEAGILRKPSAHPKVVRISLWVAFGVGLPIGLSSFYFASIGSSSGLSMMAELVLGPIMAPGYLVVVALFVEKRIFPRALAWLAKVGRVALTTYLGQTLICTAIFYSWGFGQFGELTYDQMMGVVAGVWLFNLVFAQVWLKFFDFGPVEWGWRSLTLKRVLPIRKRPEPELAPPPLT